MQLQEVNDRAHLHRSWFSSYKFKLVENITQVKTLVDHCISRGLYSLDLETTGLNNKIYPDSYFNDGKTTRFGIRTVDKIVGICMSFDGTNGYYLPLSHNPLFDSADSVNLPWDETWEEFIRLAHSKAKPILHNSRFDFEFFYAVTGKDYWEKDDYEDIFFLAKVISPLKSTPSGLKPLMKQLFNSDPIELDELFTPEMQKMLLREGKRLDFSRLHPKEGLEYGCQDGIFTYKCFPALKEKMDGHDQVIYNLEKSFCNVIRKLERNRVHLDRSKVNELLDESNKEIEAFGDIIREAIESKTGKSGKWLSLNIGSPKQLSQAILTDPEGLKLKPTLEMLSQNEGGDSLAGGDDDDNDKSGEEVQYTLKDEALKSLDKAYGSKFQVKIQDREKTESIFALVIEWRHYLKMKGSFMEPLQKAMDLNDDVRPNFNQIGTDTTRLSAKAGKIEDGYSGINFQGIPRDSDDDKPELFKRIRECIIPRPGWVLVKLDYAGEELRVITNMSGDKVWTNSFLNGDGDVHKITAMSLFGKSEVSKDERGRGKKSNFAIIYGGGAGAVQRNIGNTMEEAQRGMDNLRNDVPELMGFIEHQKRFARKHKCVYTAYGRRIPIPTIDSPIPGIKRKAERCAINYTIQATSADVLKFAMCYVDKNIRKLGWEDRVRYILTVHDEVVYEIRPEYVMEIIPKLDEWMVFPWKVKKVHGREWVVPLETEPGVDINWRARFDFFRMVNGIVPIDKKTIVNGEYVGKLKKDEFFENGRIYQKIPDILKHCIFKKGPQNSNSTVESSVPTANSESPSIQPVQSTQSVETPPKFEGPVSEPAHVSISDDFGTDLDLVESKIPESKPESIQPEYKPTEPKKEIPEADVMRWTFRAVPSKYNANKLNAICVLAEGNTPLRVIGSNDEVLVHEKDGPRVNREEFITLCKLFGLG